MGPHSACEWVDSAEPSALPLTHYVPGWLPLLWNVSLQVWLQSLGSWSGGMLRNGLRHGPDHWRQQLVQKLLPALLWRRPVRESQQSACGSCRCRLHLGAHATDVTKRHCENLHELHRGYIAGTGNHSCNACCSMLVAAVPWPTFDSCAAHAIKLTPSYEARRNTACSISYTV